MVISLSKIATGLLLLLMLILERARCCTRAHISSLLARDGRVNQQPTAADACVRNKARVWYMRYVRVHGGNLCGNIEQCSHKTSGN